MPEQNKKLFWLFRNHFQLLSGVDSENERIFDMTHLRILLFDGREAINAAIKLLHILAIVKVKVYRSMVIK